MADHGTYYSGGEFGDERAQRSYGECRETTKCC